MDITTVIINYQTPDYLEKAVISFKKFYPNLPLLIIDNGSKDESINVINELENEFDNTRSQRLDKNIFHGPAMDLAARELVDSKYIFFLDSDTETLKGGFIENMLNLFMKENTLYGVGELNFVNKRGFNGGKKDIKILQTPFMNLDREKYLGLKPFIHHGQPTLFNFQEAKEKGFTLEQFPISDFIYHKWRGTAERYGYGLGLKGKVDYLLNALGI